MTDEEKAKAAFERNQDVARVRPGMTVKAWEDLTDEARASWVTAVRDTARRMGGGYRT